MKAAHKSKKTPSHLLAWCRFSSDIKLSAIATALSFRCQLSLKSSSRSWTEPLQELGFNASISFAQESNGSINSRRGTNGRPRPLFFLFFFLVFSKLMCNIHLKCRWSTHRSSYRSYYAHVSPNDKENGREQNRENKRKRIYSPQRGQLTENEDIATKILPIFTFSSPLSHRDHSNSSTFFIHTSTHT